MENLKITSRVDKNGILILKLDGFVDASNISLFDRQMHEQIEKGYHKIVLNCSELQYMNSSAMGILLEVHKIAAKQQGGIRILNLPPKFKRTFDLLGFNDYFQVFSEEEKAIQSFF